jgi:hypothetical protein
MCYLSEFQFYIKLIFPLAHEVLAEYIIPALPYSKLFLILFFELCALAIRQFYRLKSL